jgi:hypothetical protein
VIVCVPPAETAQVSGLNVNVVGKLIVPVVAVMSLSVDRTLYVE